MRLLNTKTRVSLDQISSSVDNKSKFLKAPVKYLDLFKLARPYIPGEPCVIILNIMTDQVLLKEFR